jgi:hypothetical protein
MLGGLREHVRVQKVHDMQRGGATCEPGGFGKSGCEGARVGGPRMHVRPEKVLVQHTTGWRLTASVRGSAN